MLDIEYIPKLINLPNEFPFNWPKVDCMVGLLKTLNRLHFENKFNLNRTTCLEKDLELLKVNKNKRKQELMKISCFS